MIDSDPLSRGRFYIGVQIVAKMHDPGQRDVLRLRHRNEQASVAFGQTLIGAAVHVVDKLRPVKMRYEFTDSFCRKRRVADRDDPRTGTPVRP